jgi:hypothetical protein
MAGHAGTHSRLNGWQKRVMLAALIALQGVIAFSPLLEVSERGRLGAHVEQQGASHRYQHDEGTCAVCKVRSMHSAPAGAGPILVAERLHTDASRSAPVAPPRTLAHATLPRAPPQLT